MSLWSRTDTSPLSRWWWTVDRVSLAAVVVLVSLGLLLNLAASPPIAARHGLEPLHFFYRQLIFVGPGIVLLLAASLLPLGTIKRYAVPAFGILYVLLLSTLIFGTDVNGARRWLSIGAFAIQPSEFLKPVLVVALAMLLCEESKFPRLKRYLLSFALVAAVALPTALQPDYGQTTLIVAVWGAMLFLAGLPIVFMVPMAALAAVVGVFVYRRVEHVAERIDGFIDPSSGDPYQVNQALSAFKSGGLAGAGIGEGRVKWHLPDAHTDFIFAVAGEEFGLFFCLLIVLLFACIVFRGLMRAMRESDSFVQLAASGLAMLLATQAFVNLGVNVHILPAKGMTLPFVSYGGSSLFAVSSTLGLLLALTRRRIKGGLPKRAPMSWRVA